MTRAADRGQALVEFALIAPIMLVMLLGMIDLGRAFVFGVSTQDGVREAARLAQRAATDVALTDSVVLDRLIAASNPALLGCASTLNTQQTCGGGTWTLTIDVLTPNGTPYTSIAAAKADANFPGSKLTVTARGSVSLLAGFQTSWGWTLSPITVQGQAAMVVA